MRRTYKYRLLGNKEVFRKANNWLILCRRLYNIALEQHITIYHQYNYTISYYDQIKQLPELKVDFPEYKGVYSDVLQEVIERLGRAYEAFFKRVMNGNKAGFPRFKGRDRYDSFTLKKSGRKLNGKYLTISKIGIFKLRLSRPIRGIIKTITLHRESTGKWYVLFSCNYVPEIRLPKSNKAVGIDMGIKSLLVDSEGNKVDNPLYFRQSEALLRRRQRRLSRRMKGSNRRLKAKILVAKLHEKVRNQRSDLLHKLSTNYIKRYGILYIENLNIMGLIRNNHLSKSISDSSWGNFFYLLSYKAEEAGRTIVKVSPNNTSQLCSGCGTKVSKSLAVRIHACPKCGLILDRDENAARNILKVGQTYQELTKETTLCVS